MTIGMGRFSMGRYGIVRLLAGLSALALPTALAAQEAAVGPENQAQAAAATDDPAVATAGDDDIVVTAQRRAESVQRVPIAVTAVRGDALQRLNITSPQQLTLIDPSVKYKQSTSAGNSGFLIRGIGTSSFSAGIEQSISTVVDGVVLGDPSTISTLVDIERVEILRGPQGMLFGKNASAGLVSFTTVRPKIGVTELIGRTEFGTNGHHVVNLIANLPVTDDLAVRLVGFAKERDGVVINRSPFQPRDVDGQLNYGGGVKLMWRPTDTASLFFSSDYSEVGRFCCSMVWAKNAPGYAPAVTLAQYGIVASDRNREVAIGGRSYGYAHRGGASIEANFEIGDYSLTSLGAYRQSYRESFYDGDNTTVNYVDRNGGSNALRQLSQELRLTSPTGGTIDYVAGLFFFDQRATGFIDQQGRLEWIVPASNGQVIRVVPTRPVGTIFDGNLTNRVHSRSYAGYAQANVHAGDRLNFIVGGRLTHDELNLNYSRGTIPGAVPIPGGVTLSLRQGIDNTNFSFRLGAQYTVVEDVMAYATVSRGYKGPGFSGLTVTNTAQDQSVAPEIPTNYEIGVRASLLDRRLTLNATLFKTEVRDFQAQVADLSSASYANRITNAGSLDSKGVEFSIVARPTPELTLSGGGAYVDARYGEFEGVQCYFGQPKVAQGGPCVAPPANPNSIDGFFNAAGLRLAAAPKFSYNLVADYQKLVGAGMRASAQVNFSGQSDVNYAANGDPGTIQKAFGLLGANIGIGPDDNSWRVGVFAINLLNQFWAAQKNPSPTTTLNPGGYLQYLSPDSVRTVGATLDFRF
ncbi:TonB-dependent receptor [Sphingomonas sp. Leaf412]|uniref:TonB-dependent receptor n=1 Tax=Sphingomonas sp. Leaf412 TaxID=1736370 RepID=UPI0009E7F288|nr:TonB-dependent receptor [Sphingomonas sp. Leaf412]